MVSCDVWGVVAKVRFLLLRPFNLMLARSLSVETLAAQRNRGIRPVDPQSGLILVYSGLRTSKQD